MVKHIIIWNFKEELSADERKSAAERIKKSLEALSGQIDGLAEIKVFTSPLETSNGDIILDSTFADEAALQGYQVHPMHVEAAAFVRSVVCERKCMDFEI